MTPWSTEVELFDRQHVRVAVMLSLDPGPMREFRPFLDVVLDEAHATELLGKLALALEAIRSWQADARGSADAASSSAAKLKKLGRERLREKREIEARLVTFSEDAR